MQARHCLAKKSDESTQLLFFFSSNHQPPITCVDFKKNNHPSDRSHCEMIHTQLMSYKPMILGTDNGRKMQKERGCLTQYNITDPKDGTIQGIYRFVVRAHAHPDLPEDSSDSEFCICARTMCPVFCSRTHTTPPPTQITKQKNQSPDILFASTTISQWRCGGNRVSFLWAMPSFMYVYLDCIIKWVTTTTSLLIQAQRGSKFATDTCQSPPKRAD